MQTARVPRFRHVLTCAIAAVAVFAGAAGAEAATLPVNSNNLTVDGSGCDAVHCSLPEAINAANVDATEDTIAFDASMTITVPSPEALPVIANPVTIQGTGATSTCSNTALPVTLIGHLGAVGFQLDPGADGSRICRMRIGGFASAIAIVPGADNVIVDTNRLGTDGSASLGGGIGVEINGANTTVTGSIVSGNTASGISIGAGAGTTTVSANRIGTNLAGTAAIPNGQGVSTQAAAAIVHNNLISGNSGNGVIANAGVVTGNRIGTSVGGTTALPNGAGVNLDAGSTARIGGTAVADANTISGNTGPGIRIFSGDATIQGNRIGTDDAGTAALPNADGISVREGSTGAVIGGTAAGAGNVISGNTGDGIATEAVAATSGLTIQSNTIGLQPNGSSALANGADGINIGANHSNVTIGGTSTGAGNLISGNNDDGIEVFGDDITIAQNTIGLNASGSAVGNGQFGVVTRFDSEDVLVGGSTAGHRNVITGNKSSGILVGNDSQRTTVQGNYLGLAADGSTIVNWLNGATPATGNLGEGVSIATATDARVGGTAPGEANVIGGNRGYGVALIGGTSIGAVVEGNLVGTDATGLLPRGNIGGGVLLATSQDARIGGTAAGARNVISGNLAHGLDVQTGTSGAQVHGNLIGVGADGTTAVGNAKSGVFAQHQSLDFTLGGTSAGQGNTIRHNIDHGVEVGPAVSFVLQTELLGNSVRDNGKLGIDLGDDGVTANDAGDGDVGDNDRQNFPVVTGASTDGAQTSVTGTIDTVAGHQIRIEVFSSAACDPSGHGEGDTLLGAAEITSAAGPTPFTATVAATDAARQLTTTATDLTTGQTSEFSACQAISFIPPPTPIFTGPSSPVLPVLPPAPAAGGTPTTAKVPAKLKVRRAGIDDGVLDLLVEITSAAATSGAKLELDYESSGRRTKFSVPITTATKASGGEALLKVRKKLPSTQPKDTGIIEIAYAGNAAVAPDEVRLRAADVQALLVRSTTSLSGGRLQASGTVSSKARGVVRLRLGYTETNGTSAFQSFNVTIKNGRWSLDRQLTGTAAAGGYLSIQFTGYESAGMRGEQTGKQLP